MTREWKDVRAKAEEILGRKLPPPVPAGAVEALARVFIEFWASLCDDPDDAEFVRNAPESAEEGETFARVVLAAGWVSPEEHEQVEAQRDRAEQQANNWAEECSRWYDEAGLPKHLPMGVTEDGQGPEDDSKAHHWICWCGFPQCQWTQALARERERTEEES